MAKRTMTYADLIIMAALYGVDDNALFISAAKQYMEQKAILSKMEKAIKADGVTDEDGRPNALIRELPKHTDAANRTLGTMLDIITKIGRERKPEGSLQALIDE